MNRSINYIILSGIRTSSQGVLKLSCDGQDTIADFYCCGVYVRGLVLGIKSRNDVFRKFKVENRTIFTIENYCFDPTSTIVAVYSMEAQSIIMYGSMGKIDPRIMGLSDKFTEESEQDQTNETTFEADGHSVVINDAENRLSNEDNYQGDSDIISVISDDNASGDDTQGQPIESDQTTDVTHDQEQIGYTGIIYSNISERLQEILDNYPHETELEKIIENSCWAKVETADYCYAVGKISDGDDVYVAVAIRGGAQDERIDKTVYDFVPVPEYGDDIGYWVVFNR